LLQTSLNDSAGLLQRHLALLLDHLLASLPGEVGDAGTHG
jgi:hypothetical protein